MNPHVAAVVPVGEDLAEVVAGELHQCLFAEVEVDEDDGPLRAGMRVLIPCPCGETPLDHLETTVRDFAETEAALLQVEPFRPLYHWAPASRRKQITRYGLRPRMRVTTSTGDGGWRAPYVCFADTPSWAWALSGDMPHSPSGEWDLWQTNLARLTDPFVLASEDRPSGIYEVRTEHRLYKRHLWLVGSRVKP